MRNDNLNNHKEVRAWMDPTPHLFEANNVQEKYKYWILRLKRELLCRFIFVPKKYTVFPNSNSIWHGVYGISNVKLNKHIEL